jgi:hypothetical protein
MLLEIVICTLCAAGVLLLIWILIGWFLLPMNEKDCCLVLCAEGDAERLPAQLRACWYLQQSGLLRGRVIVADCGMSATGSRLAQTAAQNHGEVEVCPAAELPELLEKRR